MTDQDYLKQAIDVGNQVAKPYNFGAVVVKDGQVIAAEHGRVLETNDPSLHSEVSALAAAGKKLGNWQMDGATLYCSHEPCTMCFSCAAWAHIDRIVYVTPASEQEGFMYEFKEPNLQELIPKLMRSMTVEQMPLNEEES